MLGEALALIKRCVSKTADQCDKPRSRQNQEDPVAELLFEHCCAGKCSTSHVLDPGALWEHSWLAGAAREPSLAPESVRMTSRMTTRVTNRMTTVQTVLESAYDNTYDRPYDKNMTNRMTSV